MGYIDLHVHSRYSDGKLEVKEALDMAVLNNVSVLAFTEHYNISSLRVARRIVKTDSKYSNIEIIPGIEIGTNLSSIGLSKHHICHILAYFVSNKIYPILNEYEEDRMGTNTRIINALNKQGISISITKIRQFSNEKSFGRYTIARYLAYKGYAYTPEDAYAKYLDYGQMAHIERRKMSPEELITKIIACGGVPVIAHPRSLKLNYDGLIEFIEPLMKCGLAGIEIYYPRMKKEELEMYKEVCDKYGLIGTVGSDFHRIGGDAIRIGLGIENNLCIEDYSIITKLKQVKHDIDNNSFRR